MLGPVRACVLSEVEIWECLVGVCATVSLVCPCRLGPGVSMKTLNAFANNFWHTRAQAARAGRCVVPRTRARDTCRQRHAAC